eukprot:4342228-Alexandrium_andersonii.AAC.1
MRLLIGRRLLLAPSQPGRLPLAACTPMIRAPTMALRRRSVAAICESDRGGIEGAMAPRLSSNAWS